MLNIQVLGSGMIPRIGCLAPRKEFFKADLMLVETIVACRGLQVNMKTEEGKIIPITSSNVRTLWNKYRSDLQPQKKVEKKAAPVVEAVQPPKVEEKKPEVKDPEVKVEEKKEVSQEVKEEKKEEEKSSSPAPIKPVINKDKK